MAVYAARTLAVPSPDAKQAAVAVLLLLDKHSLPVETVLIKRQKTPHDRHSGQISFPGGRLDPDDLDLEACALREAAEEIDLPTTSSRALGRLSALYIPVSDFFVTPVVVAVAGPIRDFTGSPDEVEAIYRVPLSDLARQNVVKHKDMVMGSGLVLKDVPYFDLAGQVVWGATAMILNEFRLLIFN